MEMNGFIFFKSKSDTILFKNPIQILNVTVSKSISGLYPKSYHCYCALCNPNQRFKNTKMAWRL